MNTKKSQMKTGTTKPPLFSELQQNQTVYYDGHLACVVLLGESTKTETVGLRIIDHGNHVAMKPYTEISTRLLFLTPTHTSAAIRIQKVFRGFWTRRNMVEQRTFEIWQALEDLREAVVRDQSKNIVAPAKNMFDKELEDDYKIYQQWSGSMETLEGLEDLSEAAPTIQFLPAVPDIPSLAAKDRRRSSAFRRLHHRESILSSLLTMPSDVEIDPKYKGPRLSWPMAKTFPVELLEHYRESPEIPLPMTYAWVLISHMEEHLEKTLLGSVLHLSFPKRTDSRIIVVGDTHGQLNDVLWIFYKFGPPSPNNIYLFNGDIADRGSYACEIFFILFAYKLMWPDSVIINRGNHESLDLNEVYGFSKEIRSKYNNQMFVKFQDVFHLLPLCTVVEKRICVLHGGLFRRDGVTLEMINNVNRRRPCPASPELFDDTIMFDILWSDPQHENGRGRSTRGADCISFGADVTADFLKLNNLEVCIRSHQVPPNLRGFEPLHEGYCVTLFSASNYCGTTGNFGGVIIFEPDMAFEIQEYMAPSLEEIKMLLREAQQVTKKVRSFAEIFRELEARARIRNRRSSVFNMQRDVSQKIASMVCKHKEALFAEYQTFDPHNAGIITTTEWRSACGKVIGDSLPWLYIQKSMHVATVMEVDSTTKKQPEITPGTLVVKYQEFLSRFLVEFRPQGAAHGAWKNRTIQQIFESIVHADLSLKETLLVFDRNCDGTVSYREFFELISELDLGLSESQVRLLMRVITSNHAAADDPAARMDAAEFLGRFKVMYGTSIQERTAKEPWVTQTLDAIGRRILADKTETAERHYEQQQQGMAYAPERRRSSAIRSVALFQKFKEYNEAGDGFLSYIDFTNAIKRLPSMDNVANELGFRLDDSRLIRLAESIDATSSGKINYLEFLDAFHVTSNSSLADEMWNFICEVLYRAQESVIQTLISSDPNMTGLIDIEDFRSALLAVNNFIGDKQLLTIEQIESLVNFVDVDDDDCINYLEFFNSFVIVDKLQEQEVHSPDESSDESASIDSLDQKAVENLLYGETKPAKKGSFSRKLMGTTMARFFGKK